MRWRRRTWRREPGSRPGSTRTSSSSTAAGLRCRRSLPIAPSSSSAATRIRAVAAGYLNAYRLLLADLVVVTMAESRLRLGRAVRRRRVRRSRWRARGRDDASSAPARRRSRSPVAYFCAAPDRRARRRSAHISRTSTARWSSTCPATSSNRGALRDELERISADVYLVELKAAAIDVVAEAALAQRCRCRPRLERRRTPSGPAGLDEILLGMAKFQG